MLTNRRLLFGVAVALANVIISFTPGTCSDPGSRVEVLRTPDGGIQPQAAIDTKGIVHLVYFKGNPGRGDLFYVRSSDDGKTFSPPLRVNSQGGSAIALGTIRGAQIAIGRNGRVHVAWNGSNIALPKGPLSPEMPSKSPSIGTPMLYARLNDSGTAFEPQRNLMTRTSGLDGGGSVAADSQGHVYVAWHAVTSGSIAGEDDRQVWVARSLNDGKSFAPETVASREPTGACGCCGLRIFAASNGNVYLLFRSATNLTHRDIHLLVSQDGGRSFQSSVIDRWEINACPMTSMSLTEGAGRVLAAWQTQEEVYYASIGPDQLQASPPVPAPGKGSNRKYAFAAANTRGRTILVWNENSSWGKGGSLAWQIFDRSGQPEGERGSAPNVPTWSFGSAFVRRDGSFGIVY